MFSSFSKQITSWWNIILLINYKPLDLQVVIAYPWRRRGSYLRGNRFFDVCVPFVMCFCFCLWLTFVYESVLCCLLHVCFLYSICAATYWNNVTPLVLLLLCILPFPYYSLLRLYVAATSPRPPVGPGCPPVQLVGCAMAHEKWHTNIPWQPNNPRATKQAIPKLGTPVFVCANTKAFHYSFVSWWL